VRSLFFMNTGTTEERYTLECFPCVFLLASRWLATWRPFAAPSAVKKEVAGLHR
jgi:hypothetical protein